MKGLTGKVALVTGGSSGIGLAAARELGRAGARVALVGRGRERGEAAERALREEGLEALYVQADMGKGEDVRRMVEEVLGRWDRLDVAVNNAALGDMMLAPLTELPEEEFDRVLGVDPMGRLGEPEECGKAIAWLLSEEASYVNGCVMTVDGGVMAGL